MDLILVWLHMHAGAMLAGIDTPLDKHEEISNDVAPVQG